MAEAQQRPHTVIGDRPPSDGREWEPQCARCGSSVTRVACTACVEGYVGHDCGEDTCCCLDPEDNMECDTCNGAGGWFQCLSSPDHCEANPNAGHEQHERGVIEWFTFAELEPK